MEKLNPVLEAFLTDLRNISAEAKKKHPNIKEVILIKIETE